MIKSFQPVLKIFMIVSIWILGCGDSRNSNAQNDQSWQKEFNLSERTLVPTGRNDYFILEPGFQLVLEGTGGFLGMTDEKLVITVLDETKEINGITTRIMEEREWKNDNLYEVARNFFAIDKETGDAFYFGEEVDFYKDGEVINHKGAWLVGENDATAGLAMPGKPKVGMKYYQEISPGKAMDRAEVIDIDYTLETPAGTFSKSLKTKEGSALKLYEKEYKSYAPGIGIIQDQNLYLTKYGFVENY